MADTPTALTPEQKEQARRETRAAAERARRAKNKKITEALEAAGLDVDTRLTEEQKDRAAEWPEKKGGLRGRALASWVMDGRGGGEQVRDAQEASRAERRADATRKNVTRSADPDATELAVAAKALAPDVKSSFLPKEAREFLDTFAVKLKGDDVVVRRTGATGVEGALETATIPLSVLVSFAQKGERDREVRATLAGLGKGTRLWGRKLGLFILEAAGR